ncbi:DapH/DapD/GlmU-related protein [Vibrio sp. 10N.261.52.C11]|uniref:DapH/DapD/GlmU-related protein n=1 Tax=Vibrio sp. 10N.261.52.C11 TaxID=3229680 RepID=UPI0035519074
MINTDIVLKNLDFVCEDYESFGQNCDVNGFASIKKIEKRKVYYCIGSTPDLIDQSIVIISDREQANSNVNFYILVDNPQLVFYKLMNEIYKNNVYSIADSSFISNETKLGTNINVDENSVIRANSIGSNVSIGANVVIHDNVMIGDNVTISDNTVIGAKGVAWIWDEITGERVIQPQIGYVEIGNEVFIGSNVTIVRGSVNESTIIDNNCLISHGSQIGHGVKINHHTHIANNCTLAGNVVIGSECFIGASATFASQVKIANRTTIGAGAIISKSIENEGSTYIGMPARAIPTQNKLNGVPKRK